MNKMKCFFLAAILALNVFSNPAAAEDAKPAEMTPSYTTESLVKVKSQNVRLNLLMQTWGLTDSSATTAKNNFRIRRTEVKLSGELNDDTRWFLMMDPSKTLKDGSINGDNDNKILQDLGLAYRFTESTEVSAGQFKIPTVAEGLDSSSELILPERSLVARQYGDKRQTGVQVAFKQSAWKVNAMLSNGGNPNTNDTSSPKDIALRSEFTPYTGLNFGGFVAANDFRFGSNGKWGLNLRWKGDREMVRFEIASSNDTPTTGPVNSKGYLVDVGYFVIPKLQPVFRFEQYMPNTGKSDVSQGVHMGLNYWIDSSSHRLQLAYSVLSKMKGSNGSYTSDLTSRNASLVILTYQMAI